MIEIKTEPSNAYYLERAKIQEVLDELQANGFEINPNYYNTNAPLIRRVEFSTHSVEIIIKKGDFYKYIDIHLHTYNYKKSSPIKFDTDGVTIKFDIEKVNDLYKKWYEKTEKAKIRNNVSKFKGDLLLSYIRGKFDEYDVVYTEPRKNTFQTDEYEIVYSEPTPSELVKLNMERVKVWVNFTANENYSAEVYLVPFLKSPKENMEKVKEFIDIRDSETDKLTSMKSLYQKQITEMENELKRVFELGHKLNDEKYKNNMKELFWPRKKK